MGANIASEVADEKFCETTIGQTPFRFQRTPPRLSVFVFFPRPFGDSLCFLLLGGLFSAAGARNEANGLIFKELLQTPNFRITVVDESDTVELCGALKVKAALRSCSSHRRASAVSNPASVRPVKSQMLRCRTSWRWVPGSATAWASATTPRRR